MTDDGGFSAHISAKCQDLGISGQANFQNSKLIRFLKFRFRNPSRPPFFKGRSVFLPGLAERGLFFPF